MPFLICDDCQNDVELDGERMVRLLESQAEVLGPVARGQILEVHGLCAECRGG